MYNSELLQVGRQKQIAILRRDQATPAKEEQGQEARRAGDPREEPFLMPDLLPVAGAAAACQQ